MNTSKTYYKLYIQKNNKLKLPRYSKFGHINGGMIFTTDSGIYNLNMWEIGSKELLPFDPFQVVTEAYTLFDEMLENGFNVEIVTDLWADWEFDGSGDPIRRTVSPVNGVKNRRAVWRPFYQYFSASKREYIADDGGTFDSWGDAFLESYRHYHEIKDKVYKGGFV